MVVFAVVVRGGVEGADVEEGDGQVQEDVERAIMPEELSSFEQCFVTGTAAEVTPVSEIAGNQYQVGEIIKTLINSFRYPRLGPGQMWERARDKIVEDMSTTSGASLTCGTS